MLYQMRHTLMAGLLIGLVPSQSRAANVDDIAYFSNKHRKELSGKAVSMIATSALGVCGRRRELKITGRGQHENWPEIIQSALKRDQPNKRSIRVHSVNPNRSSVLSAVTRVLMDGGYH